MPRVCVLVPFPLDESGVENRRRQQRAVKLSPDMQLDYKPVKAGPALLDSHHDYVLGDLALLEVGLEAAEEGYDAICIDTMSDSGANALRSMLDVPVVAPGRASYLTALMLGNKFSVLTQWDGWKPIYEKGVKEVGLSDHLASIRSINVMPDLENLLGGKEEVVFPMLQEEGMRCVEDGAQVICLGSTTMHDAAGFLEREPPGARDQPGTADLQARRVAAGPPALAEPAGLPQPGRAQARDDPRDAPGGSRERGLSRPRLSCRLLELSGPQQRERLVQVEHVAVLGVDVEQRRLVRARGAVGDRVAGDDDPVAVLHRVDRGGANAPRGRGAGDDHRVDVGGGQHRRQRGAEEARGEQLVEDRFTLPRRDPLVDLRPRATRSQREQRRDLVDERLGDPLAALVVLDRGERDRAVVTPARPRAACAVASTAASVSQCSGEAGSVNPRLRSMITSAGRVPAPWRLPRPRSS